ncbi:MAG: ATP-dependent metallopeptidase FtsH/Yme1/Tma family protein [Pedosphaera sp.]|nr:ATP-dependent metallopeptidase FtsH/Yme1/Tma family protein [Pedosphaera sp.]
MADDNSNFDRSRREPPSEPRLSPKTWIIWILVALLVPALIMVNKVQQRGLKTINYRQLMDLVESNRIDSAVISADPSGGAVKEIRGIYREEGAGGKETPQLFTLKDWIHPDDYRKLQLTGHFRTEAPNTLIWQLLYSLLPFLLIAGLVYFLFVRQIKAAGKGALSFGKSKARLLSKEKNKTTFKDVAGVEEAKDEVFELVEFLRDPKKFQKLGGRIPKGVLMVGPPGTGKTLLAKAIAGEADACFFSISGSDFVEMFVGVGASRVRDMFEQARKNTPCLIFIDEIDAVGRSRGHGLGGGNDEREQTLNALLVEMDGFDTQEGIIIIAATNRPDVLDPALLRPGRFDRQVTVSLPDVRGREAILKVHAKNVKLDSAVDLSVIARGTPGFSGAELANLLNEAALLAARTGRKAISMTELEEARDKVRWGRERRSLAMTDEEKRGTAWHEAGHALVNVLLTHTHPLHKVTIIPRGQALGITMFLPKQDLLNRRKKELQDMIAVTMAGRIAEEIFTEDVSSGASGDIQQATQMAKAMVMHWGMSDTLGMVQYGENSEYVFLGRDMIRSKEYSERTAQEIDNEVKRITDAGYQTATTLIRDHRDKLELIAKALLEHETLEGWQVIEIVKTGKFTPPPVSPSQLGPPSGAPAGTPLPEIVKLLPPKLPGFGSPAPAAA